MLPKISIVTPSFKSAHHIESTIKSILSQGYPNLEYIVVDGAGDDTAAILTRYASELAYWCSEPDEGQYDAINKGFRRATGDVLMWLNADDMLLPNALFVVGEIFRDLPEVDWISSLNPTGWDASGYLWGSFDIPGFSKQAFLDGLNHTGVQRHGCWIQQESTCFRRTLWEKAGGAMPAGSRLAGDFALWCAFYRHADLVGVTYPIGGFRSRAGQRSEAADAYATEAFAELSKLREECGWKGTIASRLRASPLGAVPKIGKMAQRYGYVGQRITKRRINVPDSGWHMLPHRFLLRQPA